MLLKNGITEKAAFAGGCSGLQFRAFRHPVLLCRRTSDDVRVADELLFPLLQKGIFRRYRLRTDALHPHRVGLFLRRFGIGHPDQLMIERLI